MNIKLTLGERLKDQMCIRDKDVLSPGLAGAFATLQFRVLLDHVLPELCLLYTSR